MARQQNRCRYSGCADEPDFQTSNLLFSIADEIKKTTLWTRIDPDFTDQTKAKDRVLV
jgi:hypothetical protein